MRHYRVVLCLGLALPWTTLAKAGDVPSYDNDDLRRVSPRRGETGVASQPPAASPAPRKPAAVEERGETFWRHEAEKVEEQLGRLREQAAALRLRIEAAARRESAKRRPGLSSGDGTELMRERLRMIEDQIREREARFEERARREGALPGWLR